MNPLESYIISYHITCLPTLLYVGMHECHEIPRFEDFEVPQEIRNLPVECRFVIYDKEGNLIKFSSQLLPSLPSFLTRSINTIPLKMVYDLLKEL